MQGTEEAVLTQVDRILRSDTFRNADNLRKLLKFLAERLAQGDADQLKEYTLGIDALGKPPTYDPRNDATVRIQVGRLRQKLSEYYQGEGKDDPVLIALPKGRFRLTCEARPVSAEPAIETPESPDVGEDWWRRPAVLLSAALGLAVIWGVYETVRNGRLEREQARTEMFRAMWTPELEQLWRPFVEGSRPLIVSIADPPFMQFEGFGAYRDLALNTWDDMLKSPAVIAMRKALGNPEVRPNPYYAPVGEVNASFALGKLIGPRVRAMSLLSTSDLSWQQMADNNLLYIGAPVFFTQQLNGMPVKLELANTGGRGQGGITNLNPRPGEPARLVDQIPPGSAEDGEVYALVTHVPGPRRTTEVTAFTSNRTPGRLAAVEWFTDAMYARTLVSKLRNPSGEIPRYYQVALRVKFKNGVPTETSYLFHHELKVPGEPGEQPVAPAAAAK
jgi:hypothetical protein